MEQVEVQETPSIVLSKEVLALGQESEGWKALRSKVREACETRGYFLVEYSEITSQHQEEVLRGMKAIFDVPQETKTKHMNKPGHLVYIGQTQLPLYESIGIFGEDHVEETQALADLKWPEGNNEGNNVNFCEVVNSMNSKLKDLNFVLMRLIFEAFGIGKHYEFEAEKTTDSLRATKYRAPTENGNQNETLGLTAHVDKNTLSTLCENGVPGLEVLHDDEGQWRPLPIPKGSWLVLLGNVFEVWTNGLLHGVRHRVMMSGDKERYSYGCFSTPREGVTMEVPPELVDNDHPALYRPFIYSDFLAIHGRSPSFDILKTYAGI
ncbi:2-oxoglutarate-dependent dioxygenase AOP1 [Actinidia chinensis var. chinensis]|uniref:2-oxoglutarate-dependent dioxygenase AOP1 n=1 Tax=Actinidia chinensis var. chinensis TaxID=1590841 RepID=A0A2R6R4F9_ACTCC|nr:2-oxoglutarate-dependent dioxygenase AOP1 [Actinidia chinensis var. chinensis]